MEHLALEVFDLSGNGSTFAVLPPDTRIHITETSELFDRGDVWSLDFTLNVHVNAHIFGTAGEMHGSRLHEQIDKRRARLWAEGLPMFLGYLRLDDEVDVDADGNIDVGFESGRKTFYDMVDGVKANQVPIPDDILIGMAVDRERTVHRTGVKIKATSPAILAYYEHDVSVADNSNIEIVSVDGYPSQMYPKYVVPYGEWTKAGGGTETISRDATINTDFHYSPQHPFCNIRICYQLYGWKTNDGGELEKTPQRKYKISEPDRVNPAPCFFVESWIEYLMKNLGIYINENQLLSVEDFLRLFFVNTKCGYATHDADVFTARDQNDKDRYLPLGELSPFVPIGSDEEPSWELTPTLVSGPSRSKDYFYFANVGTGQQNVTWKKAYATSANFPEVDISDVISSIESGFGVRFLFNSDYTQVRIVLLREVLKAGIVNEVSCDVKECVKRDGNIRGFRLTYGAGTENTDYYYQGFEEMRLKQDGGWIIEGDGIDYSKWNLGLHFHDIKEQVSTLNRTCYVDSNTGNAYIVKIDENFKSAKDEAFPSVFECGQWMDAEDGDCTGEDDTVKEIRLGFKPMQSNRMDDGGYALFINEEMGVPFINQAGTRSRSEAQTGGANGTKVPSAASLKINDAGCSEIRPDIASYVNGLFELATATAIKVQASDGRDKFTIEIPSTGGGRGAGTTRTWTVSGWIREGYRLYLDDNYKPNDELESPLEKPDWGLMFGIMRGSNNGPEGASVIYTDDVTDGEGNDTWELQPGAIASAHSDLCNEDAELWDYRPRQTVNGNRYGDYIIDINGGIHANIHGKKGPAPSGMDTLAIIDTYYTADGSELFIATEQGYYFIDYSLTCRDGNTYSLWLCCVYNGSLQTFTFMENYFHKLCWGVIGTEVESMRAADLTEILSRDEYSLIVFATREAVPYTVLQEASQCYLEGDGGSYRIPAEGSTVQSGRISLKLRAEKPNPFFNPSLPENNTTNRRYLEITNPNLRRRGLIDQFHKEESYWWRNAKTANLKCGMGIAELMGIDKTVRQHIGDVTGFVKKLEYDISLQDGLGDVNAEVWYL